MGQKNYRLWFTLSMFLLLLLSSCTGTQSSEVGTSDSTPTILNSPIPTSTSAPTNTPTPTPTVSWPINQGTAIPDLTFPVINKDNASSIKNIARFGYPASLGCRNLASEQFSVVSATIGGFDFIDKKSAQSELFLSIPLSESSTNYLITDANDGFSVSPDGKYLLGVSSANQFSIWNNSGEQLFQTELEDFDSRYSASLSPDGSLLALGACKVQYASDSPFTYDVNIPENDCTTQVINWSTGEVIKQFRGRHPVFSPDGKVLVISFDKKIEFFSTADWSETKFLGQPGQYQQFSFEFSPSGNYFSLVYDNIVEIYRISDFKLVRSVGSFELGYNTDVRFSADEKFIMVLTNISTSYSSEESQYLVEISSGDVIQQSNDFVPDCTWLDANNQLKSYQPPSSYEMDLSAVSDHFAPQEDTSSVEVNTAEGSTKFDLILNGKVIGTFTGLERNSLVAQVGELALVNSSVGGPGQAKIQLIDLNSGSLIQKWDKGISRVIEGDHYLLLSTIPYSQGIYETDYSMVVVDIQSKNVVLEKQGLPEPYVLLESQGMGGYFNADQCLVFVSLVQGQVPEPFCFIPTGEELETSESIQKSSVSPDGKIGAFSSDEGNIYLVDLESLTLLTTLKSGSGYSQEIEFSKDGAWLASFAQDEGYTKIWAVTP